MLIAGWRRDDQPMMANAGVDLLLPTGKAPMDPQGWLAVSGNASERGERVSAPDRIFIRGAYVRTNCGCGTARLPAEELVSIATASSPSSAHR